MSKALPDYYEVLGLTPKATPEQLKKRYRELARRYHPDVNPSADASNKIKAVNEAYHTLGDVERRERYDAERLFASGNGPAPGTASPSSPRPNSERSATPPPGYGPNARSGVNPNGANRGGFDYDGFGRSNGAPRPSATPPNVGGRPSPSAPRNGSGPNARSNAPTPEQRTKMVEGFLTEAQLAFINHKYVEAEDFCRRALALDRRNGTAHEIMGDVFLKLHRREEAATAYSYAIQANPRNYAVQGKLERVMGGKVGPERGPTMTRPVPSGFRAGSIASEGMPREAKLHLIGVILAFAAFLITAFWYRDQGSPIKPGGLWIFALSPALMTVLVANGAIAGALLAFYGRLRPASEELSGRGFAKGKGSADFPLGLMLSLFSIVWFGLSLIVFIVLSMSKGRVSSSLLRSYGLTIFLTLIFSALYTPAGGSFNGIETALFAGNLLFPAVLAGWRAGDAVRFNGLQITS